MSQPDGKLGLSFPTAGATGLREAVKVASAEDKPEENPAIGLGSHTVRVVPHRDEWHALSERELGVLRERVGHFAVDVQHVGSTAVEGLDAKPIIDIALAVPSAEEVPRLRRHLEGLGYTYGGDAGDDGGHVFVKESAPGVLTHHLHVVASGDPQWREWLVFRDKLRADEALRARYADLKRGLQQRFAGDRRGYTEAKNEFIDRVIHPGGSDWETSLT